MSRGFIFEVTNTKEDAGYMSPEDLIELAPCEFDFTTELTPEGLEERRMAFIDRLNKMGADTYRLSNNDELVMYGQPHYAFYVGKASKYEYFSSRFVEMKRIASEMSIEEFSSEPYRLEHCINNRFTDAVYYNGTMYTMDSFIRDAVPGVRYYLGNVLLMH